MIISIDTEKALTKIWNSAIIKTVSNRAKNFNLKSQYNHVQNNARMLMAATPIRYCVGDSVSATQQKKERKKERLLEWEGEMELFNCIWHD